jgi:hypothetical protein
VPTLAVAAGAAGLPLAPRCPAVESGPPLVQSECARFRTA